MIEVTCFHCGYRVQISPDVERCESCGTNLRRMISADQASHYFYARAADLSTKGNIMGALQEAQRGIAYVPSTELNMLAAIFCNRLGRLDDMRHHVAAIPADDPLRGEAEWLLRAHNARQRRTAEEPKNVAKALKKDRPQDESLPLVMEEVLPSPAAAVRKQTGTSGGIMIWLALAAVLLILAWLFWRNPPTGIEEMLAGQGARTDVVAAESASSPAAQVREPSTTEDRAEPSEAPAAENAPLLLAPPTANPALTTSPATPEEAEQAAIPALDWPGLLTAAGRADLAALPVTAALEGTTLRLAGTVETAQQLAELQFHARQVPDVLEVVAEDVEVRLPATYTVAEGDTLWSISVLLYGDGTGVDALFEANQDVMPSPNALQIGMELKVPPRE